jgi:aldose 1-epimerase
MKIKPSLIIFLLLIFVYGCKQNNSKNQQGNSKMMINKEVWGKVDGKDVFLFSISNKNGVSIKVSNYGGIITSILTPDRNGKLEDIVLGYDNLADYLKDTPYFGSIIGRYANRIANGKFTIDNTTYELAVNNGANHLHGGIKAFDKVVWDVKEFQNKDEAGIELNYLSTDGEEGYPGNLTNKVIYSLSNKNELIITYEAITDKATPVNLTHHSYFNLSASKENILNHRLHINADYYIPVNEYLIPTGDLAAVKGTAMDFRNPNSIGERISQVDGGYDHTYVINGEKELRKAAELTAPKTGRKIEVFTTEPGMQFYTGNFLDGSLIGKDGIVYQKHFGLCLETQHFPDSPNQPNFPNTILKPGEKFSSKTIYKFGIFKM